MTTASRTATLVPAERRERTIGDLVQVLSPEASRATSDPIPVEQAAEYVLHEAAGDGKPLNYAALQEACYYAQAAHLGDWGRPLFDEQIEAGEHGPRIPALDPLYAEYADGPIPPPDDANLPLPFPHWMQPGNLCLASARVLGDPLTIVAPPHGEEPWRQALRTGGPGAVVSREAMASWAREDDKRMLETVLEMPREEWEARTRAAEAGPPGTGD